MSVIYIKRFKLTFQHLGFVPFFQRNKEVRRVCRGTCFCRSQTPATKMTHVEQTLVSPPLVSHMTRGGEEVTCPQSLPGACGHMRFIHSCAAWRRSRDSGVSVSEHKAQSRPCSSFRVARSRYVTTLCPLIYVGAVHHQHRRLRKYSDSYSCYAEV